MPRFEQFATQDLPMGARFEAWQARLKNLLGDVAASTSAGERFSARSNVYSAGDFEICHMSVEAQRIELPPRSTINSRATVHAVFPVSGEFHIAQSGHAAILGPDQWTLYDLSKGFISDSEQPVEIFVLAGPRPAMLGHDTNLDRFTARRLPSEGGSARMAKSYLASLMQEYESVPAQARGNLAALAAQLIQLTLLEYAGRHPGLSARDMMRARIETYINRNLRDPDLSIAAIADAHNCSKRYVHSLFCEETLSGRIRRARLEHCFRDLSDAGLAHLSVTEIAFSWGFENQAHFSRIFRQHFNVSPSSCRTVAKPA